MTPARKAILADIFKANIAWIITTVFLAGTMYVKINSNAANVEKCAEKTEGLGREVSTIHAKVDGIDSNVQLILKKLTR